MSKINFPLLFLASATFFVIVSIVVVDMAEAENPNLELKKVKAAIEKLNYSYRKPRSAEVNPGSEFLPKKILKLYVYSSGELEKARIDYYTLSGLFSQEKFIAAEIYIYNKDQSHLDYSVWLDDKDEVTQFQKYVPFRTVSSNKKTGVEIMIEEVINYDQHGIIIKRIETKYTLNHKELSALYLVSEYDRNEKLLTTETGGYDYDDLTCPANKRHCN